MRTFWIIIITLLVVGAATYFISVSENLSWHSGTNTDNETPKAPPREVPAGAKEYKNDKYHFSLLYPETLSVKETNEGSGAMTITFQNVESVQGFQIFIVPYDEPQVSEARFKLDNPSGVRNNLIDTNIDGATGAAFYSQSSLLGETREIWFVRGGYLYEVTTLKSLDTWLDQIVKTWKFL